MKTKQSFSLKIFIVIILFLYSCKTETKEVIKNDNVKVELTEYQNINEGIAMKIPSNWVKNNTIQESMFVSLTIKDDSINHEFPCSMLLGKLNAPNSPNFTFGKIVKSYITNDLSNDLGRFPINEIKGTVINKLPVVKVNFTLDNNNIPITIVMHFVSTPKGVYQIVFTSSTNNFLLYEPLFNYMANTFHTI